MARNLRGSRAEAIVLISANPKQHAFEQLADCPAALLLIHSDNDFTCGVSDVIAWFDSLRGPKARIQLPAGEHFFRGHEEQVTDSVIALLRSLDIGRAESNEGHGT